MNEIVEGNSSAPRKMEGDARTSFARWYGVGVLTLLYTLAFIDRQVIALLVAPIKADLGLSDVQISLLMGLAFVILFSALGIPAGWLVDRISRRKLVGFGVATWSVMTIITGFAQSFGQLFFGRIGVGVGEAAITPASFALIQATVPPGQRGKAFGIYSLGPTFGSSLSLILGGMIFSASEAGSFRSVPLMYDLKPWQSVFVLLGLLGLPLAVLALTIREPARTGHAVEDRKSVDFGEAVRHMRHNHSLYLLLIGFITCTATFAFAFGAWVPSMIGRTFGLSPADIGYRIGAIQLVGSLIGQFFFGAMIDRYAVAGRTDAAPHVGLFTVGATLIFAILVPMASSLTVTSLFLLLYYLTQGVFYSVGANCLARIAPDHLIGKVTAIYLIFQGGVAAALGPTLVAMAGQYLFAGPAAIGYGVMVVAVCSLLPGLIMLVQLKKAIALHTSKT